MVLKAISVNIVSLSIHVHHFDYEIGNEFFRHYGTDLISEGSFTVNVTLNKHETFIEAGFHINGTAKLVCDRSLEPFDYPLKSNHKVVFKYGNENQEISDEIVMIHRDTTSLELGQYIYEFIGLAIPIKKLHPKFQEEEEEEDDKEGKIIYSSSDNNNEDDAIDPRWEMLKKLK